LLAGESLGTLLSSQGRQLSPLKRWIGFPSKACGKLYVDAGAGRAILERDGSLLAVGIVGVTGEFQKGDVVSICRQEGDREVELARGLTNYGAAALALIQGLKSQEIAAKLGHRPYEEVIHRNNMVVVQNRPAPGS
jgi:glutamate 5-kinase